MDKTELCLLFEKHGSDKCPAIRHSYSPSYYEILKNKKRTVRSVLEIGIGNFRLMSPIVGKNYVAGASLRAWSDFFSNAKIFGCDIDKTTLFNEDRIFCYYMDQSKQSSILATINQINKDHSIEYFDLIIDDGSHIVDHMILSINTLSGVLAHNGIYIIEDIKRQDIQKFNQKFANLSPFHIHDGLGNWDSFVAYSK